MILLRRALDRMVARTGRAYPGCLREIPTDRPPVVVGIVRTAASGCLTSCGSGRLKPCISGRRVGVSEIAEFGNEFGEHRIDVAMRPGTDVAMRPGTDVCDMFTCGICGRMVTRIVHGRARIRPRACGPVRLVAGVGVGFDHATHSRVSDGPSVRPVQEEAACSIG